MMKCGTNLLRVFGFYCAVWQGLQLLLLPQVVVTAFHLSAVPIQQHARTVASSFSTNTRIRSSTVTDDDETNSRKIEDDDDDAMTTTVVDVNYETEPWNTNMKRSNVITMAQELRKKYGYLLNPFIVPKPQQNELFDAILELEDDFINTNIKFTLTCDDVVTMLVGDWDLICTIPILPSQQQQQQSQSLEIPSLLDNEFIQNLFPSSIQPLASFTNKFITITQRIRSTNMNDPNHHRINRVDHVIEIQPPNQISDVILLESNKDSNSNNNNDETTTTTPSWLRNLNINPFQIKESKVILIHDAEIVNTGGTKEDNTDIDNDIRVKLRLKLQSVVNNIAGTGFNLNPNGADIFSINIPQLDNLLPPNQNQQQQRDEWNDALGGSFMTTYIDDKYRISRSDLLSFNNNNKDAKNKPQQIRIFQKRQPTTGTMVSDDNENDDDMIADVDDIAIEAPSDVEE